MSPQYQTEQMQPLVSVLMTAFNREKYIAEAIESVLSSSYKHFELLIVDDCSTDLTVSIAEKYRIADARVQLYINEKNLGDYPNRNKAISFARGKYVMFCDSDDLFLPDGIAYCVESMEKFPQAGIGMYYSQDTGNPFIMDKARVINTHFFVHPILNIGPGGTILKRSLLTSAGCYPVKYGPANDLYFNLNTASKTPMLFLPKSFLHYRIHDGQEKNNIYAYIFNNYRYLDDALSALDLGLLARQLNYLTKKNNRRFAVNVLRHFIQTKDIRSSRRLWQKAEFTLQKFINGIFHF